MQGVAARGAMELRARVQGRAVAVTYCKYLKKRVESCKDCQYVAPTNLEACKAENLGEKKVRRVVA